VEFRWHGTESDSQVMEASRLVETPLRDAPRLVEAVIRGGKTAWLSLEPDSGNVFVKVTIVDTGVMKIFPGDEFLCWLQPITKGDPYYDTIMGGDEDD